MKQLVKILILGVLIFSAQSLFSQAYRGIRIAERTNTTVESFSGIDVKSCLPDGNGAYKVEFFNNNYNEPNDRTTYSFTWYLSFQGQRVSDYYQTNIGCRDTQTKQVYVWPDKVSKGYENRVTVQFGREPEKRDYRD